VIPTDVGFRVGSPIRAGRIIAYFRKAGSSRSARRIVDGNAGPQMFDRISMEYPSRPNFCRLTAQLIIALLSAFYDDWAGTRVGAEIAGIWLAERGKREPRSLYETLSCDTHITSHALYSSAYTPR